MMNEDSSGRGIIYAVGFGPGSREMMTSEAVAAINNSDIIVGYTAYVELMKNLFPDKEYMATPMRKELERCAICFELAQSGKKVAMICSGDAGVYGMASPLLELGERHPEIAVEVIAGVTAANSGAAMLGAPISHDYCVISLSDLLTPWELIEKRLRAAVWGDFAIAIYNPSSHKRADYLKRACEIMLEAGADENRACGYVCSIGREGMEAHTCSLSELKETQVNMFTTVFIGNSRSYIRDNRLITPRGYMGD